jgi:hypothetical protein
VRHGDGMLSVNRPLGCPFYVPASLRLLPKHGVFCTFRFEVLAAKEDVKFYGKNYSYKKLVNKVLNLESR